MQQQIDSWIRGVIRWLGFVPNRDLSGWILLIIAILAGILVDVLITQLIRLILRRKAPGPLRLMQRHIRWAFWVFIPSLFFLIATNLQSARFLRRHPLADKTAEILFLIATTWLLVQLLKLGERLLVRRYDIEQDTDLSHRKYVTQVRFVRRIAAFLVLLFSASLLLISFQGSRKVGLSVLTSAGVVSVVIGFAAQKTLANLLAGIQIALNQQIRLNDAVVVEKEWGRVEEINLTNVVVKLWDRRRLILPITYFVETPYENWTRSDASITGAILLYVDYRIPVETLRQKALALAEATDLWNRDVMVVQVTHTLPTCIEIRVLISAADAPSAFDLRCYMRENLIAFLRDEYPEALPQTRVLLPPTTET